MEQFLLIIIAPPSIEETIVDWLLEADDIDGFSSNESFGHGVRHIGMNLVEQVTGRQKKIEFIVCAEAGIIRRLVGEMHDRFSEVGVHYFLLPVIESGRI
jgi:hypothetical protein